MHSPTGGNHEFRSYRQDLVILILTADKYLHNYHENLILLIELPCYVFFLFHSYPIEHVS